jgi:hypothetical protein
MKLLFRQKDFDMKKLGGFSAILHWLARLTSFIWLTEEEQNNAGIYLGRQYDNDHDE